MKNITIKKLINNILLLSIAISLFSCSDFLDQDPKSSLPEDEAFSTLERIDPIVKGLYTGYRQMKEGRTGLTFLMMGMDESKQGVVQMDELNQAGLDLYNGLLNSSASYINSMWERKWAVVNPAAKAIHYLGRLQENTTDQSLLPKIKNLQGEAYFFRAMVMIELAMYWGEVPVINYSESVNLSRRPLDEVWGQIISDFTQATELLPENGSQEKGNISSGAAWAMLGRSYMSAPAETNMRDFEKAKQCFEKVMNSGYNLDSQYSNLFDESMEFNSPESIFEINFENQWPLQNYWEFDLGSRTVERMFGIGCYFAGYDAALPTEYAYKMKSEGGVWEDGDLRKDVSIRYDFTYNGMTPTTPIWGADELDPHVKKHEDKRTDYSAGDQFANSWYCGKNFIVIRYADVLLCYAECLNELGQTAAAVDIVNQVRARAWGGSLPTDKRWGSMSQEDFRVQIMDERIRELCFEGWRRMDLIRTGNFVKLIKERNPWAKQAGTIQDFHMRWPIPYGELADNPDMNGSEDQNPGYN